MTKLARLRTLVLAAFMILLTIGCATDGNGTDPIDPIDTNDPVDNGNSTTPPDTNSSNEFEVSEEVYTQAFEDISEIIENLNDLIARKDFQRWKTFLSRAYIDVYSDPDKLMKVSEQPILKDNGIVLTNIKDYFDWVVVPSRSNVRLDELRFVDETHVISYMIIEDRRTILYKLEQVNGSWKISVW